MVRLLFFFGFSGGREPRLGFRTAAASVSTQRVCLYVPERTATTCSKGDQRSPSFWECPMRLTRCDHDRGAYRDCCNGACGPSPKRGSQGWGSSSDNDDSLRGRRLQLSQPPPPLDDWVPTTPPVSPPPCFQSPPVSIADSAINGFRPIDCALRLRVEDAFDCYREDDRNLLGKQTGHSHFSRLRRSLTCSRILGLPSFENDYSFDALQFDCFRIKIKL